MDHHAVHFANKHVRQSIGELILHIATFQMYFAHCIQMEIL
uniref:Uncharacterized protein n=1 Tax=Anguilla anguilla TaxID=7936 RepID=A0A0E9U051_ANGAN